MPRTTRRVLVLGLDGATFDLLDPLMEAGHLPFLRRLAERGARARLASVFPPKTIPAWYSFATGQDPGGLGVHRAGRWPGPVEDRPDVPSGRRRLGPPLATGDPRRSPQLPASRRVPAPRVPPPRDALRAPLHVPGRTPGGARDGAREPLP